MAVCEPSLQSDEARRPRLLDQPVVWDLLPLGQLPTGLVAEAASAPIAVAGASTLALIRIALVAWRFASLREHSVKST